MISYLLIVGFFFVPNLSFADGVAGTCSESGYAVVTMNGVFTDENGAKKNKEALELRLDKEHHGENLKVDFLHNPSHLAGLGDLVMSTYQKVFDNETVEDYDLVEMLKDASEKVKTQKLLIVAHSQGNFYANSFYDTVAGKEGGVPAESIGVYAVATPSGRVASRGKWLTSDTDKIIAGIVSRMPFKKIMPPNESIVLAENDDPMGHNFSGVYLKHRGSQITSDIQSSLDKLQTNSIQNESSPCLVPPKLTLAHKAEGAILSIVDPAANLGKDATVAIASGAYQAGNALAQGTYSLTAFIAGAVASALSVDNKNINNEAVALNAINSGNISNPATSEVFSSQGSSLTAEVSSLSSSSQDKPASSSSSADKSPDKFKQAEESLQDLQKQLFVLQSEKPSRTILDGQILSESNSISSQPKFIATVYPGFGGGGTGVAESSSSAGSSSLPAEEAGSSSSSEADSASESSSSVSSSSSLSESPNSSESSSLSSSSAEDANSSSLSVSDTTPPDLSLFISECQQSLSSDGCLVATTTLNISWNSLSSDLDYFIINNNGAVSTTTATSTTIVVSDNSIFSFAVSARDLAGNESATSTQTAEISIMPVVINEVAWAGNSSAYSADEWVELYNRASLTVNLSDFILYSKTDTGPYLNLSGTVASRSYYLVERTDDNTVSDISADLASSFGNGLANTGENITLVYKPAGQATTTIDEIPYDFNWYAGSSFNYSTMERHDADIAGTNSSNWGTNNSIIKNGKNAGGGNINGTPKARNSANYLINKGQNISSDIILYASNSPYLVNNSVQVFNASSTLTIEPGVVIKFYNDAGFSFASGAKILAQGSSANPIIFTSFYDDSYAGDTNSDTASTAPSAGNWYGVRINSPGAESSISNAVFRYGGKYYNGPWSDSRANLYIANSSAEISDSIFEHSKVYGLKMVNSDSSVTDSIFRNNNNVSDTAGYDSSLFAMGGTPSVSKSSFVSNHKGAYFFNSLATVDSNTFTANANEAVYSYGQLGSYTNNSGSGNGVDAMSLNGTITQNGATTTLAANTLPYLLSGNVIVAANSALAVNSGAIIKGWNVVSTSYLSVYGNLIASGTNFSDIVFGSMFSSPAKGNWGGVRLYSGSQSNIYGATFEYADTAISYNGSPLNLSNVKFNENNLGVSADAASLSYPINASDITFTGNTATTSPGGLW